MITTVLCTRDTTLADRVNEALDGLAAVLRCPPELASLQEAIRRAKPALLLLDIDGEESGTIDVAAACGADAGPVVIAIGDENAAAAVLAAMRAGARDFLARGMGVGMLRQKLVSHMRQVPPLPPAEQSDPGSLVVVLSGQPNDGDSLLAINYAAMRAAQGHDTLLIDCHLPSTEAAAALDLRFTYTLRDAINDLSRLDRTLLTSALPRHEVSGLHVLPLALAGEGVNDLAPSALLSLLLAVRGMFGEIVLNIGGIRNHGLVAELLRSATTVFLVATQKFTSLKACKELLQQLEIGADAFDHIILVVEDYHDDISLTEAQMGAALALRRTMRLPAARVALINALNRGKPLVLEERRHPYTRALAVATPAPHVTRRTGFGARLRERRGAIGLLGRLVPG